MLVCFSSLLSYQLLLCSSIFGFLNCRNAIRHLFPSPHIAVMPEKSGFPAQSPYNLTEAQKHQQRSCRPTAPDDALRFNSLERRFCPAKKTPRPPFTPSTQKKGRIETLSAVRHYTLEELQQKQEKASSKTSSKSKAKEKKSKVKERKPKTSTQSVNTGVRSVRNRKK